MSVVVEIFWKLWNWWFRLPDKLRYLLVGGFNACVAYILYVLLVLLMGEKHYQLALVLSWVISSFSSFTTQKIFVFCTKGKWQDWVREYIKCVGVWFTSYVINALVLEVLVDVGKMNPYIGQILANACTMVTGYILMKYFAFKNRKNPLI